jgi:type I restriction enzyme, S subunit
VRQWGEIRKGYTHFAEGDVALAKITPCFENGKSTVFHNLTGGVGAGTTELHVMRPVLTDPQYILIYLKSGYFIDGGVPRMTGTAGQKRVPFDYFAYAPFPLPPLAEQQRIVAKVDEVIATCERLRTAQTDVERVRERFTNAQLAELTTPESTPVERDDRARATLRSLAALTARTYQVEQLRQAILRLAVRGRLVPQNAMDEPASELLQRIAVELDGVPRKGKTKLKGPPMKAEETPYELPAGWSWARFPELGVFGRGRSKHRPRGAPELFAGGTYPMVQTGDVARSRGVIRTFTSKYNEVGLAQSKMWPAGTMCITIAANIADTGILSFDACFPDSIVGFIPASPFQNARYFEYFVRTAKANLLEFAPATAQKNINLNILSAMLIPIPPLAEQGRIVTKLDQLMELCDQLESLAESVADQREKAVKAILAAIINSDDDDDPATIK